jgi:hypothetical protein
MYFNKIGKIALGIVGSFIAVAVVFALVINPVLENLLRSAIDEELGEHYSFSYEDMDINIFAERIELFGISLVDYNQSLHLDLSHVKIEDFGIIPYLVDTKNLLIGTLLIEGGEVNIRQHVKAVQPGNPIMKANTIFRTAHVQNLIIRHTELKYFEEHDSLALFHIKDLDFSIAELGFNAKEIDNTKNGFSYSSFKGHFEQTEINAIDNHQLIIDSIYFANDNILNIRKLSLSSTEAVKNSKFRDTEKNVSIATMELPVDWDRFIFNSYIHIPHAIIRGVNSRFYLNKRKPNTPDHAPKLLHQIIHSIQADFSIDKVSVRDMYVEYLELGQKTKQTGKVYFTDMNIYAMNVFTNDSAMLSDESIETFIEIRAKLMGQSELNINIDYNTLATLGYHRITGKLDEFDITALNQAFYPLEKIKFERGMVKKLTFDIHFDETEAIGEIIFAYRQLKVDLKDATLSDTNDEQSISEVALFFIDTFVIRHNNFEGAPVIGKVRYSRDPNKSFLNFWWKALFSGMKDTMLRIS